MHSVFFLFIVFQFKHFIADYLLQGKYMLGKFKDGWAWIAPLSLHCLVHALFTCAIILVLSDNKYPMFPAPYLAAFDFVVHFAMDRIKASPNLLGRWKALSANEYPTATDEQKRNNTLFWWSLGLDQMVHHLTDLAIIYMMVTPLYFGVM